MDTIARPRVVVVEDDRDVATLVTEILNDEGETIEAEIPRETWEALAPRPGERLFVSPRAVRLFVE